MNSCYEWNGGPYLSGPVSSPVQAPCSPYTQAWFWTLAALLAGAVLIARSK